METRFMNLRLVYSRHEIETAAEDRTRRRAGAFGEKRYAGARWRVAAHGLALKCYSRRAESP